MGQHSRENFIMVSAVFVVDQPFRSCMGESFRSKPARQKPRARLRHRPTIAHFDSVNRLNRTESSDDNSLGPYPLRSTNFDGIKGERKVIRRLTNSFIHKIKELRQR